MKFNEWLSVKPEITEECICITKIHFSKHTSYDSFLIKRVFSEDILEEYPTKYLALMDIDGNEIGDLNDLHASEYFLIKI